MLTLCGSCLCSSAWLRISLSLRPKERENTLDSSKTFRGAASNYNFILLLLTSNKAVEGQNCLEELEQSERVSKIARWVGSWMTRCCAPTKRGRQIADTIKPMPTSRRDNFLLLPCLLNLPILLFHPTFPPSCRLSQAKFSQADTS
jgi:hypothetical protein